MGINSSTNNNVMTPVMLNCSLYNAAEAGDLDAVAKFIKAGAFVDFRAWNLKSPLHKAVENNHLNVAGILILNNASLSLQDQEGFTPLHYAANSRSRIKLLKLLVDNGALLNSKSQGGSTPLHIAVCKGNTDACLHLINRGADINLSNNYKDTALHIASMTGYVDLVVLLMEHKADVTLRNWQGKTFDQVQNQPKLETNNHPPPNTINRNRRTEPFQNHPSPNRLQTETRNTLNDRQDVAPIRREATHVPKRQSRASDGDASLISEMMRVFPNRPRDQIIQVIQKHKHENASMVNIMEDLSMNITEIYGSTRNSGKEEDIGEFRQHYLQDIKFTDRKIFKLNRFDEDKYLTDALDIYRDPNLNLRQTPRFVFENEEGVDFAAVTKDFFTTVSKLLINGKYKGVHLFVGMDDHKLPNTDRRLKNGNIFQAIGRFVLHNVLHEGPGITGLSDAVKFFLISNCTQANIQEKNPPLSIKDILDEELLETIEWLISTPKEFDPLKSPEKALDHLEAAGFNEQVKVKNRLEAAKQLYIFHIYEKRWFELESMRSGIQSLKLSIFLRHNPHNIKYVFPSQGDMVKTAEEVLDKIDTTPDVIKTKDFKFFKQFLKDIEKKQAGCVTMALLLQFWTGSSTLSSRRELQLSVNENRFPISHACFCEIDLPSIYSRYEDFKEAFVTALECGATGFGEE